MLRTLPVLLLCSILSLAASAQKNAKRELRGAWVATFTGIDWPNRTQTPAQQRAAFITIADHHKATGINVLYVQMRSQCDAMYPSDIEPWSADLTGKQGTAPSAPWDPMAFAIEECHKRGMEFHAWLNPYRAASNSANIPGFADNHVTKTHPEWLLSQGILRVLDPGLPEVRDHILSVITDIVHRYDVDGIHFDDYFYPPAAPAGTTPYNDDATFAAYPRGFTVRADWRRDNVDLLIRRTYDSIKTIKPWVKFGVSPSGIYRNSTNPAIGTPTSGLEHYTTLFADTRKWLQEGWVDYIMPQVYWWIGQPGANYGAIAPWWNNQAAGRHIYIGMAGYKVGDAAQGAAWQDSTQIPRQVRMNRDSIYPNIFGQSVYNTNSLRSNRKNFRDSLRLHMYVRPALLPAMRWRDSIAPIAPEGVNATPDGNRVQLSWLHSGDRNDQMNRARQFVVYRSESPVINTEAVENILAVTDTATNTFTDTSAAPNTTYYYTVTALDRFHNESVISNLSANLPPEILCPGDQQLNGDADCSAVLPDFRSLVIVSNPDGVNITQYPEQGSRIGHNSLVHLLATNAGGKSDTCTFSIQLRDTVPPQVSDIAASPAILTVPNNKLHTVSLSYNVTDCNAVTNSISITSNEPSYGAADWEIVNDHTIRLRAERNPLGNGRIYTITVTSTDASGNTGTAATQVLVPGNKPWTNGDGLAVTALPNPTFHQFVVLMASKHPQPITLRVYNSNGMLVETRNNIVPNSTILLGANYNAGIYYLEIIQGNRRQILKVMKLGH